MKVILTRNIFIDGLFPWCYNNIKPVNIGHSLANSGKINRKWRALSSNSLPNRRGKRQKQNKKQFDNNGLSLITLSITTQKSLQKPTEIYHIDRNACKIVQVYRNLYKGCFKNTEWNFWTWKVNSYQSAKPFVLLCRPVFKYIHKRRKTISAKYEQQTYSKFQVLY